VDACGIDGCGVSDVYVVVCYMSGYGVVFVCVVVGSAARVADAGCCIVGVGGVGV